MTTGTVKWFNTGKGFGFISADDGTEVFVHISAVEKAGLSNLEVGQRVSFSTETTRNKTSASELRVLTPGSDLPAST